MSSSMSSKRFEATKTDSASQTSMKPAKNLTLEFNNLQPTTTTSLKPLSKSFNSQTNQTQPKQNKQNTRKCQKNQTSLQTNRLKLHKKTFFKKYILLRKKKKKNDSTPPWLPSERPFRPLALEVKAALEDELQFESSFFEQLFVGSFR